MKKGQKMTHGRHYLTPQDIETAQQMIEQDHLQQWKVAERIGVHTGTIEKLCKRLGWQTVHCGSRRGADAAHWQGGRTRRKGYWYVLRPDHPFATKHGYVLEHRLVMEQTLGRYLLPSEVVHHLDSNRENNTPENLMVFATNGRHLKAELQGRVPKWTPAGIAAIRRGIERRGIRRRSKSDVRQRVLPTDHSTGTPDNTDEPQSS